MKAYWLTPTGEKIEDCIGNDGFVTPGVDDPIIFYRLGWQWCCHIPTFGGTFTTGFITDPQLPIASEEPWEVAGFTD